MKNNIYKFYLTSIIFSLFTTSIYASNLVNEEQCKVKGAEYIFAGGECIQYYVSKGDKDSELNIVVHGTWEEGTNTLARYRPYAENLAMATDITTVAIALPGYSDSSTNNFQALSHKGTENLAARSEYIEFLSKLVQELKIQFDAEKINYIGHSAGAMMGSTLTGYIPGLINTLTSAGGRYNIHIEAKDSKDLISLVDYIDDVDKKTEFLLIYGTKDTISKPIVTKDFYTALKKEGFTATLVEVVGAPHLDLEMTDTAFEAIATMLDKE
ncbi:MAG: putative esterase [Arcobacteraceae bacterium]|jgi:predicted esterase